jgi:hypothetical protein
MTVNRIVHLVAGCMVLASIGLAHWVDPAWLALGAFVGINLAQSALTNFCPLSSVLRRVGVRDDATC